jgi:hypothetical protein
MRHCGKLTALGLLACLVAFALGRQPDFSEFRAVQDSLSRVHPRMRASWLRERGIDDPHYTTFQKPESSGIRCIGRWSYGPSYDVDGRVTPTETLVALARGSGVSLLRFSRQDSLTIELLSDINAGGIMKRVAVRDSLLYVGSTAGLEVYDITDEQNPVRRSWIATALNDFALQDSMAYIIGSDDSFKVYNITDPANPVFRGACTDSGDCVAAAGGLALLAQRWGLYVLDISNPASPQRVNSWGSSVVSVTARGNTAFVASDNPNQPGELTLSVLDVSVPSSIVPLGSLGGPGGYDLYLADTLIFCSGDGVHTTMDIVSIADSTSPRLLGSGPTTGWCKGVWATAPGQTAFIADDYEGLWAFNIASPASPGLDTTLLRADMAVDICIDNSRAYVANDRDGLQILDVHDPATPGWLACYDSAGQPPGMDAVVARDSFAFATWRTRYFRHFRTVDVHDPANPVLAATCATYNPPEAMVLRDSLVYLAEDVRFEVVNVARPRAPVLVGSCVTQDGTYFGLAVQDTLAYLISDWSLQVIDIAEPASPLVVSATDVFGFGVAVRDTFVYVPYGYDTLRVYSAANPETLRLLSIAPLQAHSSDVTLAESTVAVATTKGLELFSLANPAQPGRLGSISTPAGPRRVAYFAPYFYAAMWEAGVGIYQAETTGLAECTPVQVRSWPLALQPNPTRGKVVLWGLGSLAATGVTAEIRDVVGRLVMTMTARPALNQPVQLDLSRLRGGLYFIQLRVCSGSVSRSVKFVKE